MLYEAAPVGDRLEKQRLFTWDKWSLRDGNDDGIPVDISGEHFFGSETGFSSPDSNAAPGVYSAPPPLPGDADKLLGGSSATRTSRQSHGSRDEEGAPLIAKRPSLSFSV